MEEPSCVCNVMLKIRSQFSIGVGVQLSPWRGVSGVEGETGGGAGVTLSQ